MKILLLNQTFYPETLATSQQVTDLATYLCQKGHEVTVMTGQRGYDERNKIYPKFENHNGIHIVRVGSTGLGRRRVRYRLIDSVTFEICLMWRLLWTPKHDVVVSFTSPPMIGILGTLFCLLKGGHSVQWLMDVNPDLAMEVGYIGRHSRVGELLTAILDFSINRDTNIVVLDRWMKDRLLRRPGVDASTIGPKTVVIPPWPLIGEKSLSQKSQPATGENFRKKFGLGNKFVIMYSGNHSVVHPLDTILEAAKKMQSNPDVVFVFMGYGVRAKEVTEFIERYKPQNVVQLPPQPREMLEDALSAANVHLTVIGNNVTGLLHISKIYGVLATGKPYIFIGPKESHVSDLLAKAPGGLRVDHGNSPEMVKAIEQIRTYDSQRLEQIAQINRMVLAGQYGIQSSLAVFDSMIEGLNPEATSLPEPDYDSSQGFSR